MAHLNGSQRFTAFSGKAAVLSLLMVVLIIPALFANEIDTLQNRMVADYLTGDTTDAGWYLSIQQPDGRFVAAGYDFTSSYKPHLNGLKKMAIAYKLTGNPGFLNGVANGLAYYYANPLPFNGWYGAEIGHQLRLGPILTMLDDELADSLVDYGCTFFQDSPYNLVNGVVQEGQNLVWLAGQPIWLGILQDSLLYIERGLDSIKGEVKIKTGTTEVGPRLDGGFYAHGPGLMNGSYGRAYIEDIGFWIYVSQGLTFEFNAAKMDIFADFVLDGTQWLIRRGAFEMTCRSRAIVSRDGGQSADILPAIEKMASFTSSRQQEYAMFADHIQGTRDAALMGNKHFWENDFQAHRRGEFLVSLKMLSTRTEGTESTKGQNLLGYYLPFGCTYIMVDGSEYGNIPVVWDWARIPGVTAPHKAVIPAVPASHSGDTEFNGGVSNGVCGAAVMRESCDGVTGRKSWFFFDKGFVALGTGITYTGTDPVYTSLNQCLLDGDTEVCDSSGSVSIAGSGKQVLQSPRWVLHDNVAYIFPEDESVTLQAAVQTGDQQDINSDAASTSDSMEVFSLWYDHGINPESTDYVYTVLPGCDKNEVTEFYTDNPYQVLSNTMDLQAVRDTINNVTGIIFHTAGEVILGNGTTVRADKACAVLVDESRDSLGIALSNPKNKGGTFTIDILYDTAPDRQFVFNVLWNNYAGSSYLKGALPASILDSTGTDTTFVPDTTYMVSTPSILPSAGTFTEPAEITITCPDSGADIFYTTDNSNPSSASTKYTVPFTVSATTVIKARAYVGSTDSSRASTALITVNLDTIPPQLLAASAPGSSTVKITFSEPVDSITATQTGNYTITGLTVSAAVLDNNGTSVTLTVSPMSNGTAYSVTVSGITDRAYSPNTMTAAAISVTYRAGRVDNFDDKRLTWTVTTPSRWKIHLDGSDSAYHITTSSYSPADLNIPGEMAVSEILIQGDFTLSAKCKSPSSESSNAKRDLGLVFGYADSANFWYLMANGTASENILYRVSNGTRTAVLELDTALIFDFEYHTLAVTGTDSTLGIYSDGNEIATYYGTIADGYAGLCSYNDEAWFDDFTISRPGADTSALPVELTSFTALTAGTTVVLNWMTATETGNLGFNIQRAAAPGGPFSNRNTGLIAGAGTTTVSQEYAFTDFDAAPGTWYYRLEQVDVTGTSIFSHEVSATVQTSGINNFSAPHLQYTGCISELLNDPAFRLNNLKTVDGMSPQVLRTGIYLYRHGTTLYKLLLVE